jgi:hypothetical protein
MNSTCNSLILAKSLTNFEGVLHVRGSLNKATKDTQKTDIGLYLREFEKNIKTFTAYKDSIDLEIAQRFGLKNYKESEEEFSKSNSIEIEKTKWQCKLCKKKFKGSNYVEKHIRVRHKPSLVELKKSVEYFNNFVFDPKRPYLPEHPMTRMNTMPHNQYQHHQQQQPVNYYARPSPYTMPHRQPFVMHHHSPIRPPNHAMLMRHGFKRF